MSTWSKSEVYTENNYDTIKDEIMRRDAVEYDVVKDNENET